MAPSTMYLKCGLPSASISWETLEMLIASGLNEDKLFQELGVIRSNSPTTTRDEYVRFEPEVCDIAELRSLGNNLASCATLIRPGLDEYEQCTYKEV